MSKDNFNANSRNNAIDLIRGLSILSVILLHCYIHLPFEQHFLSQQWLNIIFRSGYYGVMVFFVVSGFLITTSAFRKWGDLPHIKYKQFYLMRFARIMPCLIILLIVLSFLDLINIKGYIIHTTSLKQALFSALTFHINWLEAKIGYLPGNWDVLWSLSVEEIFYLAFPIICILLKNKYQFIVVMLLFVVLGPFARTIFSDNAIWSDHSYLSCMDGIALGCLAAMFANEIKLKRVFILFLLTVGLSFFIFIFFFRKQAVEIGLSPTGLNVTFLEIGIALILIVTQQWAVNGDRQSNQLTSVFREFGRNSYEIYLTHSFIVMLMANVFYHSKQAGIFIALEYFAVLVFSGLLGHIIAAYYSNPLNKMLRVRERAKTVTYSFKG